MNLTKGQYEKLCNVAGVTQTYMQTGVNEIISALQLTRVNLASANAMNTALRAQVAALLAGYQEIIDNYGAWAVADEMLRAARELTQPA